MIDFTDKIGSGILGVSALSKGEGRSAGDFVRCKVIAVIGMDGRPVYTPIQSRNTTWIYQRTLLSSLVKGQTSGIRESRLVIMISFSMLTVRLKQPLILSSKFPLLLYPVEAQVSLPISSQKSTATKCLTKLKKLEPAALVKGARR